VIATDGVAISFGQAPQARLAGRVDKTGMRTVPSVRVLVQVVVAALVLSGCSSSGSDQPPDQSAGNGAQPRRSP
jgi:hypothetical protein